MVGLRVMASVGVLALAGCDIVFQIPGVAQGSPLTLVFDNRASTHDLAEFPVLIALDGSTIPYDVVGDPSTDLRFHDPVSDVDLPFEIERWDPAGESAVWVRVPIVHAKSSSDAILMYFGSGARGAAVAADVWQGYELVLHGKPDDFANSAGPSYAGTATGVTATDGMIAGAMGFTDTATSEVMFPASAPLFDGWSQFTLEAWVYPDYPDLAFCNAQGPPEPHFLDKGASVNLGRLFCASTDGPLVLQTDFHFVGHDSYLNTFAPQQTWSYIVYSFDGQRLWLYRNGTFANLDKLAVPSQLAAGSGDLSLGAPTGALRGMLDEVRISKSFENFDWVYAQYLAMTGKFVTVTASR